MKRSFGLWEFLGFGVTAIAGTLLHFVYDWLDKSVWIAPFSGVNESTWEHMKLLFWPTFVFAIVQYFFFQDRNNFWNVKLRGISLGISLIPIMFYTYNCVIGKSPDWLNIAIFFISAAVSFIYETKLYKKDKEYIFPSKYAIITLFALAMLFVVFTFATPKIGIFEDPLTGGFGI